MRASISSTNTHNQRIGEINRMRASTAGDKFKSRAFEKNIPPSVNNDIRAGYMVNDLWLDKVHNRAFICRHNRIGFAQWEFSSYRDPFITDGHKEGYRVGMRWLNETTGNLFRCISANDNDAKWIKENPQ